MKILIVEDDEAKEADIRAFFAGAGIGGGSFILESASNLSDAMRLASTAVYDVIVLDLLLPYIQGGRPEYHAGLELLRQIRRAESINVQATLVGLSNHPEEIGERRSEFEKAGVLLLDYSDSQRWREALRHVALSAVGRQISLDFLIIVALSEERDGFNGTDLEIIADAIVSGLNVRYVALNENGKRRQGAIILLRNMGLIPATTDSVIALHAFRPSVVCMSGICAGMVNETHLGQILVASTAWEYQAGKWKDDGFAIAPHQIQLPAATRVRLDQLCEQSGLLKELEAGFPSNENRPSRGYSPVLRPVATGSAVIASESHLAHIEAQHRKIAGIDMEIYGLYYAAHEIAGGHAKFFAAKTVVDFANSHKADNMHFYGCYISARFVLKAIRRLLGD